MTVVSSSLTIVGGLLLIHAVYSAYEHTLLQSRSQESPSQTDASLPIDIQIETVFSTLLLIIAIVASAQPFRPIRWREWAGRIEREGWDPTLDEKTGGGVISRKGKGGVGNPYRALEERKAFWDVRAQKSEFAAWVKEGDRIALK